MAPSDTPCELSEDDIPFSTINGKTTLRVGLESNDSTISNAGWGIFVKLYFSNLQMGFYASIAPLIKDIKKKKRRSSLKLLTEICDNCHATWSVDVGSTTVNRQKECKQEAASHHHSNDECENFYDIRDKISWRGGEGVHANNFWIEDEYVRGIVRLLCLCDQGKISHEEISEFRSVRSDISGLAGAAYLTAISKRAFEIVQELFDIDLPEGVAKQEVMDLSNDLCNVLPMAHTRIGCISNGHGGTFLEISCSYIQTGVCFNTFASKFNHSCTPNVAYFFNKSQLQFRAARDINAGEELTIAYDAYSKYDNDTPQDDDSDFGYLVYWNVEHHKLCRKALHSEFGFWCLCKPCSTPRLGPEPGSDLYLSVAAIAKRYDGAPVHEELKVLKSLLMEKGFSPTSYPTKETYDQLISQAVGLMDLQNVHSRLKASLEQFFLVEPRYELPLTLDTRLFTLRKLTLVPELACQEDIQHKETHFAGYRRLMLKLWNSTEVCYGDDSETAKYEESVHLDLENSGDYGGEILEVEFEDQLKRMLCWAGFTQSQSSLDDLIFGYDESSGSL
ncbi:hypothetical protein DL98DRAFT_579325 [Cadophora sp. DSE1049]|nr:hypothetical protein DL98DRAFT_579325 [Cadophora sp. DSE1049]